MHIHEYECGTCICRTGTREVEQQPIRTQLAPAQFHLWPKYNDSTFNLVCIYHFQILGVKWIRFWEIKTDCSLFSVWIWAKGIKKYIVMDIMSPLGKYRQSFKNTYLETRNCGLLPHTKVLRGQIDPNCLSLEWIRQHCWTFAPGHFQYWLVKDNWVGVNVYYVPVAYKRSFCFVSEISRYIHLSKQSLR